MIKIILGIFYGLSVAIEFLYSIPETVVTSIGNKLSELSDALETVYKKAKGKEKQIEKVN
jgi:hypothetical protein